MSVKNPRQSNDEFEKQDFYKNQIKKKSLPYNKFFFLIPFAIAQKILGNKTNPPLLKV